MKLIYLVRHAKSSWNNSSLSDFDRPLNKRGLYEACLMGDVLKQQNIHLNRIFSSSANRALSTAKILANSLSYPLEDIIESQKVYEASVDDLLNITRQLTDDIHTIMLVGHNPGLSWLINSLCNDSNLNLTTCGVCGIELDCHSWKNIGETLGKCILFDDPENHIRD